jgi:hypothetical protein
MKTILTLTLFVATNVYADTNLGTKNSSTATDTPASSTDTRYNESINGKKRNKKHQDEIPSDIKATEKMPVNPSSKTTP